MGLKVLEIGLKINLLETNTGGTTVEVGERYLLSFSEAHSAFDVGKCLIVAYLQ